jgi:uncharacterized protein Yka (UPF0111/DUF47 family)
MTDKPDPMQLANELEQYATSGIEKEVAHAVRDLIMENQKLKRDLHHYMLAANAEAELVDELQKENTGLKDRIQSIYGQLNDTEREVDDLRLLLRQALAALEFALPALESAWYNKSESFKVQDAIAAIKERLG